ncbi:MAG TPA: glycosyltransferase, partial [Chloroflexota bacterium]|nr:glycosyltransferase [Chloroflexota bacterium]
PSPIRVRPYHLIRQLARSHEVVVLTLWQHEREQEDLNALGSLCSVVGVRLSRARAVANCLRALPSRMPLQGAYCQSKELVRLVRGALGEPRVAGNIAGQPLPAALRGPFDVVHVEHLRAGYVASEIPRHVPTVFDSVDSISLLFERTSRLSHSRRQRFLARFELPRTRAYEAELVQRFDRIAVTSPEDADALRALSGTDRIAVVPNGVDLAYFQPRRDSAEPATLVLSGKMSYHANVTAALHFQARIFPLIKQQCPDVRFQIVGSDPPSAVQALTGDPAISVTGYVPDMRDYLGRATVVICPVTVKVGIQNKVLEAMAMGVPVVCTREGFAGLQAQPGQDLLVADTPSEFAAHVCRLLGDADLRSQLGQAGRRYVENYHQWNLAARRIADLYQDAIEQHKRRSATDSVTTADENGK